MRRLAWILCAAIFACAHNRQSPSKEATSASPSDTSDPFEIVAIDDEHDPLDRISDEKIPFGSGIAIFQEAVPLGPKHFGMDHFARIVYRPGEPWLVTAARFLRWADHAISLPPGERFGFEELSSYDTDTQKSESIGLRTYVLSNESVIDRRDVADAYVLEGDEDVPSISIAITFNEVGARKLETVTAHWIDRRFAILSHGEITTAPVVQSAIRGGKVQIAVGPRTDREVARAKKLVQEILEK